jgi:hypothetical protein
MLSSRYLRKAWEYMIEIVRFKSLNLSFSGKRPELQIQIRKNVRVFKIIRENSRNAVIKEATVEAKYKPGACGRVKTKKVEFQREESDFHHCKMKVMYSSLS